jgi:NAD(P)H-quinone oxidoreductase subunit N
MALLTTGKPFIRAVEQNGAVAIYAPLEGGFEGRYQRRLRASGYEMLTITARGLGDLEAYLTDIHGVRPPHLGKKNIAQEGAVGPTYYVAPVAGYPLEHLPPKSKGLVIWLLEGFILSKTELEYLVNLPKQNSRIKVVIEMGGERYFRWQLLQDLLMAA